MSSIISGVPADKNSRPVRRLQDTQQISLWKWPGGSSLKTPGETTVPRGPTGGRIIRHRGGTRPDPARRIREVPADQIAILAAESLLWQRCLSGTAAYSYLWGPYVFQASEIDVTEASIF